MKRKKEKQLFVFCLFCVVSMFVVSCGAKEDSGETEVMGRISAVSEDQITISVFDMPQGERPEGTPPADMPQGERPEGTPPADMPQGERPEGTPPADMPQGERPEGTPPADMPQGGKPENNEQQSKTISISKNTKVYQKNGEEKKEMPLSDLDLGNMVLVTLEGEEAVTITVQKDGERPQKSGEKKEK